mmetsp:Transcript_123135/g.394332  ORF Transcript_123135/g.394332 Transcript_123135/m.394332 type:complete len:248 (-) Transcript_123135:344-1087(-)|eukprot:CAMPEP_0203867452 /NCGR_PEP_ID=MMETSP0359-20131031/16525_1 /ASSEMBLY_ACC=CAM_ASM_000338 /TAXON_ID=268821 /ORGANISM="Scrippsiella Hangoei, Strain SHTV-5" /LENGTH=247 /DNA_ID=CAMNT_0050785687 /DNA_START=64 /DNA_END=807 /DNA_ORIENTATION=+
MPSVLKTRQGRPSVAEMRADLQALRKPTAKVMEDIFNKYYNACMATEPPRKDIVVQEPEVNWKALIMSLPKPQNSTVLGCGIRKIHLAETECIYHGVYRFHVEHLDGSRAVFDFRDAYDDSYHTYKDKSFKHDVELALRAAVLPQLVQYKEMLSKDSQMELVSHISGVALPWEKAVVQHFPITLHSLIDAFLNEHQLQLEQVKLEFCGDHGYKIKDRDLADKWRIFHRSQAHYRIISTDEAMEQDHL